MGVVFLARQEEPVKREVALKVIKAGMDTEEVIARFEIERQALTMMDHTNIARVLDAGSTLERVYTKSEPRTSSEPVGPPARGRVRASLLGIVLSAVYSSSGLGASLHVLFIGNSFTQGSGDETTRASSVGGVPGIFDRLARAGGHDDPNSVMRAVGGMDYEFHSQDAATQTAIQSQPWDYVILQNYSTEPTHLVDGSHSLADHITYGTLLYDQILAHHPDTQVILYETWSRAADHGLITGVSGPGSFASTDQFQEEIRTNYLALADALNRTHPGQPLVTVAAVGDAWQNAGGLRDRSDPEFRNLHSSDRYHGNDNGYYLAAAVFYSHIYKQSPEGLSTDPLVSGLSLNLTVPASTLEGVAWSTVATYLQTETETFLFDFGAAATRTLFGIAPDDPSRYWNNISAELGADPEGVLPSIVSTRNRPSGITLSILQPFNGANGNGTLNAENWPAHASQDSLFGNSEAFNGQSEVFPSFRLTGLATNRSYRLTFYASRTGVADNRETTYTVTGAEEWEAHLNAANSTNATAVLTGITPLEDQLTITLGPSPQNNNSFHFTYLGILQLDSFVPEQPLHLTEEPADQTVLEFRPATFQATVSGSRPLYAQWWRDGLPVTGADQLTLSIPEATLDMDNAAFTLTVSNTVSTLTSRTARLTVLPDETPPTLVDVRVKDQLTLELGFSEELQSDSALDPTHYEINGGAIEVELVQAVSARTVLLSLADPIVGTYTLLLRDILDRAGNRLALDTLWTGTVPDLAVQPVLIDFGAPATRSAQGPVPLDPDRHWNNLTEQDGAVAGRVVGPLVTILGTATEVRLQVLSRFNGANANGTTSSTLYPVNATRDSLYGNTESWNGLVNVFPAFKLTGLKTDLVYTLVFYASRTGVGDNRETEYRVEGATTHRAYLNPANNLDQTITLADLAPSVTGELAIYLSPSAANNNGNHFTYLGLLEVRPVRAAARMHVPIVQDNQIRLHWDGAGFLEEAPAWDGPWHRVEPPPTPPYLDTIRQGEQRWYRLGAPSP